MSSFQYRKSHCGDKTVVRSSYLHNGISYTGKTTYSYCIRALVTHTYVRVGELLRPWHRSLSRVRRQATTWTITDFLSLGPLGINFIDKWIKIYFHSKQYIFENGHLIQFVKILPNNASRPFHSYSLTLTPAWISNNTNYNVWYEITNSNSSTIAVWEWISNFIYTSCGMWLFIHTGI